MPELGSSGSARGVSSNVHPYRDPGPEEAIPISRGQREVTPQSDAALRENSYYHHTVAVSLSDSRTL